MKKTILLVLAASVICDAIPYGHYNPHRHGSYQDHYDDQSPDFEPEFHHHDWHNNRRVDHPHQHQPSYSNYRWSDSGKYHVNDDDKHSEDSSGSPSGTDELFGGVLHKDVTKKEDSDVIVEKQSSTELPKQGIIFGEELQKGKQEANMTEEHKEQNDDIDLKFKGHGTIFHQNDDEQDPIIPMEHKYGSEEHNTKTTEAIAIETTTETIQTQPDLNQAAGGIGEQINGAGEQKTGDQSTESNPPEYPHKHHVLKHEDHGDYDVWDFYSEEDLLKHYNEYHDHKHHLHKDKDDSLFVHQAGESNSSTIGGGEASGGTGDLETVPETTSEKILTTTAVIKEIQTGKAEHHHGYHVPCHHDVHGSYGLHMHSNGHPEWYSSDNSHVKESKDGGVNIDVRSETKDKSGNTGKGFHAESGEHGDPDYLADHYDFSEYY